MSLNWNNYREQFPIRYLEHSYFDKRVIELLDESVLIQRKPRGLDIGGGITGTLALKEFAGKHALAVDLLDPFITNKPSWINRQVDWTNKEPFDFGVARGAINYLSEKQLQQIQQMLTDDGIFIANTFITPPSNCWQTRPAVNGAGEVGIERYRLNGNQIEHQLIFQGYSVSHDFFYRPLELFYRIFPALTVEVYAKNSVLLVIRKN